MYVIHELRLKQHRYDSFYMDIAKRTALMSYARRLQVGCVLVKNDSIISFGWNGMPKNFDNNCEYVDSDSNLVTRPEVLHAESNCLMKLAKSNESSSGSILYLTHSPCMECSKLIFQANIQRLVYLNKYRTNDGPTFLLKCGVSVEEFNYDI